jgi:predicted O-methyltransferase YrrM
LATRERHDELAWGQSRGRWLTRARLADLSHDARLLVRRRELRDLRARLRDAPGFPERFAVAQEVFAPGPAQNAAEIAGFLEYATGRGPRVACEIGTQDGGNFFLLGVHLTTVDRLVGVDLHVRRKALLRGVLDPARHPVFIEGSSYAGRTAARVRRTLGGRPIDLLFIDGDHSEAGVSEDWELWSPLVARGGTVVFHDARASRSGGRGLPGPTAVVDRLFRGGRPLDGWTISREIDRSVAVTRAEAPGAR